MVNFLLHPASALMVIQRPHLRRSAPVLLLLGGLLSTTLQGPVAAGPLVRRTQERKACQEFATKLQGAGGNTAAAQQVYQQGVLQLVARFGENPCSDIPAPTANPVVTPATTTPPPANSPVTPAAAAPSAQQQQACQQFASKLKEASTSGGSAAAKQTYAMGLQKLTGMFGNNPCPSVTPPQ